ncbi:MAG TPA: hypothetical protein VF576_09655 [Rubricoccaceae bacterium]
MRSTLRSLGLRVVALSGGLLALLALPACGSDSESAPEQGTSTVDPAVAAESTDGEDGSDDQGPGDVGDGTESLDADGHLGDSTSADGGGSDDVGGDGHD